MDGNAGRRCCISPSPSPSPLPQACEWRRDEIFERFLSVRVWSKAKVPHHASFTIGISTVMRY
jgi:hypothetical protein